MSPTVFTNRLVADAQICHRSARLQFARRHALPGSWRWHCRRVLCGGTLQALPAGQRPVTVERYCFEGDHGLDRRACLLSSRMQPTLTHMQGVGKVVKFTDKIEDFESKPVWATLTVKLAAVTSAQETVKPGCSCRKGPVIIAIPQLDCAPRRCCLSISSDTSDSAARRQPAVL